MKNLVGFTKGQWTMVFIGFGTVAMGLVGSSLFIANSWLAGSARSAGPGWLFLAISIFLGVVFIALSIETLGQNAESLVPLQREG